VLLYKILTARAQNCKYFTQFIKIGVVKNHHAIEAKIFFLPKGTINWTPNGFNYMMAITQSLVSLQKYWVWSSSWIVIHSVLALI